MKSEFENQEDISKLLMIPTMGQDLFNSLPSEIISSILLRLPTKTIMRCRCVCKPWLDLLSTPEFVKLHLSASAPCLAAMLDGEHPKPYKVSEFMDKFNLDYRWRMHLKFNLPCDRAPYSSVNGLLLLCSLGLDSKTISLYQNLKWPCDLSICNPITREYINLPCPPETPSSKFSPMQTFGFGVSRVAGEYKVVRISHEWSLVAPEPVKFAEPECQVYTVGSGWRSGVASPGPFKYEGNAKGAFLNGNLHWLVCDLEGSSVRISCFDLETELFSTLSPPPCLRAREDCVSVSTLRDRLCLCDNSGDDEIVIWLKKEYGDDKPWTKEFVIRRENHLYKDFLLCPIKAYESGPIFLMALGKSDHRLVFCSPRCGTIREVDLFGVRRSQIDAIICSPSFVSLKTLTMGNVSSF